MRSNKSLKFYILAGTILSGIAGGIVGFIFGGISLMIAGVVIGFVYVHLMEKFLGLKK
jgi:hypothetical protein